MRSPRAADGRGDRAMTTDDFPVAATVILILPMLYFLIAALTFFLARFTDPIVVRMLRGLFNMYFVLVAIGCLLGTLAFLTARHPSFALGIGLIGMLAVAARRWFLDRIDAAARAAALGDPRAADRVRRLHLGGMAYNAVQFAIVVAGVPHALMRL